MGFSSIFPLIGTTALAVIATLLGQFVMNMTPATPVPESPEKPDPAVQTVEQQSRRQSLPAVRPEIFYAAITERPLFAPTRRPVDRSSEPAPEVIGTPEPVAIVPSIQPPTDLQLSGILGDGLNRSAFVARVDESGEWLRLGAEIDGWTITEIGPEWIILTAGEDIFRLELFE